MRWTVNLDGGPKRVNHAAVALGERIYSFGGYCTGEDYERIRPMDVHMLNTVTLRWRRQTLSTDVEELKQTPYQRYGHTAVAYEGNAYIWGGRNDRKGPCCRLFRYSGRSLKWTMPAVSGRIPEARDGHSACVINHRMYVFAGYEDYTSRFSNDMNYVDLKTFQWVSVSTNGQPARWRDFHTATAIGDVMYIFGGRCDEGGDQFTNRELYCNRLMAFDTKSKTWSLPDIQFGRPLIGRRSHSAFAYDGCLYIFGGYNGNRGIHFNDLHVFNFATKSCTELKPPGTCPSPCRRQCCCVIDSKVYFFGGTSPRSPESRRSRFRCPDTGPELVDRADLFILDFNPSLKTLASMVIIKNKLDCRGLPQDLAWDLSVMITNNTITSAKSTCKLKGIKALR